MTEPNTATTSTYTEYTLHPAGNEQRRADPGACDDFCRAFEPSSSDANYLPPPVVGSGTLISMNGPTGPGAGMMIPLGTQPAFLGIPVGGTANNVTANNYFPTPRGRQSVEYLVNKARAQLRWRSRAVKISFDCSFDFLAQMNPSCRKNATVYDPRLPGGVATGKIISYGFTAKDGEMLGHVEIGCAVGYGGSISAITGTPVYASAGYVQSRLSAIRRWRLHAVGGGHRLHSSVLRAVRRRTYFPAPAIAVRWRRFQWHFWLSGSGANSWHKLSTPATWAATVRRRPSTPKLLKQHLLTDKRRRSTYGHRHRLYCYWLILLR